MIVQVQFKSGVPVYLQIVEQVKSAVASGALRAGEPLPSVRVLAEDLRLNRNTVARAYSELETLGVIETRQGSGCYIKANGAPPLRRAVRAGKVAEVLDAAIVEAHHLQIGDDDLRELLEERLKTFENLRARRQNAAST